MQQLTTACVSLGLLVLPSVVYQASITGVVRSVGSRAPWRYRRSVQRGAD